MLIALDYDDTYTEDPKLWDSFIANAQRRDHEVIMVTARHPEEKIEHDPDVKVFYTGRKAKDTFMAKHGYHVDVWIDDMPEFVGRDHK